MTCIVAVEHQGRVWMGADSFMGNPDSQDILDQPKIFRLGNGTLLVGYAGTFRAAQIAQYALTFRAKRTDEPEIAYLVTVVAKALRRAHREAGVSSSARTDFLVARAGKVYYLQADYSVMRSAHGYAAIGAGADFALGALAAMTETAPKARVEKALAAAERHAPQVKSPFSVLTL